MATSCREKGVCYPETRQTCTKECVTNVEVVNHKGNVVRRYKKTPEFYHKNEEQQRANPPVAISKEYTAQRKKNFLVPEDLETEEEKRRQEYEKDRAEHQLMPPYDGDIKETNNEIKRGKRGLLVPDDE
jgi:hypothetical protein